MNMNTFSNDEFGTYKYDMILIYTEISGKEIDRSAVFKSICDLYIPLKEGFRKYRIWQEKEKDNEKYLIDPEVVISKWDTVEQLTIETEDLIFKKFFEMELTRLKRLIPMKPKRINDVDYYDNYKYTSFIEKMWRFVISVAKNRPIKIPRFD